MTRGEDELVMTGPRLIHCWETGPLTGDGCSTTCMELKDHSGPHVWVRDDQITLEILP